MMLTQKGNSTKIRLNPISATMKENIRVLGDLIVDFVSATQNALEGIIREKLNKLTSRG